MEKSNSPELEFWDYWGILGESQVGSFLERGNWDITNVITKITQVLRISRLKMEREPAVIE